MKRSKQDFKKSILNGDKFAKSMMIVLWMPTVDSEEASADELYLRAMYTNVRTYSSFKVQTKKNL